MNGGRRELLCCRRPRPDEHTAPSANGELYRLFFRWRSTEAKLTRRERIRLLVRLNRLTEANSVEVIADRSTPEHQELKAILHKLASPYTAAA